eukprot:TRINITY_DN1529_c0_g6_i1.p1 TRINITY_DN1529_c0_g6~~TRINITY_DN1529_c0_g6_i1.p1  ORF type:complete len:918 (+),score=344.46 TRINITY_DN1529_c0_g6_i1:293-2755(+)
MEAALREDLAAAEAHGEGEADALRADLAAAEEEHVRLEVAAQATADDLASARAEANALRVLQEEAATQHRTTLAELADVARARETAEDGLAALRAEREAAAGDLAEAAAERDELAARCAEHEAAAEAAARQRDADIAAADAAAREASALRGDLAAAQGELAALRAEHEAAVKAAVDNVDTARAEAAAAVQGANLAAAGELATAHARAAALEREVALLVEGRESAQGVAKLVAVLEERVAAAERAAGEKGAALQAAEQAGAAFRDELVTLRAGVRGALRDADEAAAQDVETPLPDLVRRRLGALAAAVDGHKADYDAVWFEKADVCNELRAREGELAVVEAARAELEGRLAALQQRYAALQESHAAVEAQVISLQAQHAALQQQQQNASYTTLGSCLTPGDPLASSATLDEAFHSPIPMLSEDDDDSASEPATVGRRDASAACDTLTGPLREAQMQLRVAREEAVEAGALRRQLQHLREELAKKEAEALTLRLRGQTLEAEIEKRARHERALSEVAAQAEVDKAVGVALREQLLQLEMEHQRATHALQQRVRFLEREVASKERATGEKDAQIMHLEAWAVQAACKQAKATEAMWREEAAASGKQQRLAVEYSRRAEIAEATEWRLRKENASVRDQLARVSSKYDALKRRDPKPHAVSPEPSTANSIGQRAPLSTLGNRKRGSPLPIKRSPAAAATPGSPPAPQHAAAALLGRYARAPPAQDPPAPAPAPAPAATAAAAAPRRSQSASSHALARHTPDGQWGREWFPGWRQAPARPLAEVKDINVRLRPRSKSASDASRTRGRALVDPASDPAASPSQELLL